MDPGLFVVCDYGQILSAATLAVSHLGGINLHASLLPKYRGAAPINWALYHGESQTGVSVIHMTPKIDAGPVIAQGTIPIQAEETAVELEARLSQLGAWFVRRAIDALESGHLQAVGQDPALASKAPRLKKTDGLIDWLDCLRDQESVPSDGALAQNLHLLASVGRDAHAFDCRSSRRRRKSAARRAAGYRARGSQDPLGSCRGRRGRRDSRYPAFGKTLALDPRVPLRPPDSTRRPDGG